MLICGFFVFGTESEYTIGYVKCGNQVDCIYAGLICYGTQQCPDGSMKTRKSVHKVSIVLITGFLTRLIRRVPLVEQKLLILLGHMSSPPVFGGVRVTRSLTLCVVDRSFSFCTVSVCHCLVWSSSIYGLLLPLWYLQTLLTNKTIVYCNDTHYNHYIW